MKAEHPPLLRHPVFVHKAIALKLRLKTPVIGYELVHPVVRGGAMCSSDKKIEELDAQILGQHVIGKHQHARDPCTEKNKEIESWRKWTFRRNEEGCHKSAKI